jgi:thiosulfate reductase/polysulfide reductase chain A
MHNTQVQELAEALGRGADLVVVDPRFSVAASKARYWLPIKPGTDIALLLAWIHVIIGEGRHDADFVAKRTTGFTELAAHVADKTPEWAAAITDLPAELIRASARTIASARPASLIHPGRHTVWYGDDTQRERAMAILVALLGSWGRRGGYLAQGRFPLAGYPMDFPASPPKPKADRKKGLYPLANEVLASGLCDAARPGQSLYALKAWMVYGCNLLQAMPDRRGLLEAIQQLELLVAIDVLPSEICGFADVVLPEATFLERDDDAWNGPWRRPFMAIRQEVVPPAHDARPGWWIAKQLAEKTGLGDHFPWKDAREYLQRRLAVKGQSYEELARTGVLLGAEVPTCEEDGADWAVETESGKVELYSRELEELGFEPLPVYHPQDPGPEGYFRLLTGRSPLHTFGRTVNNRLLAEPYPENEVWLNADVARGLPGFEARPLAVGERVVLQNQDGIRSTPVRVKLTQRIRRDCVFMVHGWGQTARRLRYAHGRGASDSLLTSLYKVDPIMGGTGMNVNFVRFERVTEGA